MMDSSQKRITVLLCMVLVYILGMIGFLFFVQVIEGDKYDSIVRNQSERRVVIKPKRGMILDRYGRVLARSVDKTTSVKVNKADAKRKEVGINRLYQFGVAGAPVLGATGRDYQGWGGAEYSFNQFLAGEEGYSVRHYDGKHRSYNEMGDNGSTVINGADVHLTIDIKLQEMVEEILVKTVEKWEAKNAVAVVMNPHNGEVLALAATNRFNPNYYWEFKGDKQNYPISFNYEPGSTYKVMTLAAALEEGLYKPGDSIDAQKGVFKIYDHVIRDHAAFNNLSLSQALWYSSNVCFAKMGVALGKERMYKYLQDFGFGYKTGITLPGEENGLLKDLKDWSGRTEATIAFGHEFTATLLQVASAFSVVANGGNLVQPRIYTKVTGANGELVKENKKKVVRKVISSETARQVREMMEGVVTKGTARNLKFDLFPICGKTGTSEKIDDKTKKYSKDKVCASFVGMVPVDNPKLVCAVMVDEPKDAAPGGTAAAPVVTEIFRKIAVSPGMSYGIVKTDGAFAKTTKKKGVYPDMVGFTRIEVARLCGAKDIPFEFVGDGELIAHQTPDGNSEILDNTPLVLFTDAVMHSEVKEVTMPNCVGQNLKDAINALSLTGITPHFVGLGAIKKQNPTAGTILTSAEVCTLYCEVP